MEEKNRCFRCKVYLELKCFGKDKSRIDGLNNRCLECARIMDRLREKRRRSKPYMVASRKRHYQKNSGKYKQYFKNWYLKNKNRKNCHNIVDGALKDGSLKKKPCENCGILNVVAHHPDYNKPLYIMWLCRKCHSIWHKNNVAIN